MYQVMNNIFNIISIIGPTACGKTKLSVKLAARYNGEIISGDSRQVYRGMDIGTGKDLEEYNTPEGPVPYHLIDIADPAEDYNLYRYISDFDRCYNSITVRGKLPILCGGSGLYIEAALKGYELPDIPEDRETRDKLEGETKEKLLALLMEESPEILSRTDTSSSRRIIRSIEIARHMKRAGSSITPQRKTEYKPLIIGITLPREEIISRIDRRLEKRLGEGMIEEVETLLDNGVPAERLIKLGLEYRYCTLYLKKELTIEQMTEKLSTEIHRFAKRQMTWFRGMERRGLQISWIQGDDFHAACRLLDEAGA